MTQPTPASGIATAPGAPAAEAGGARARTGLLLVLHGLLGAGALYPLASVALPPLADYPNHLARAHILANYGAIPELRANYALALDLSPNLAMDLLVPPLIHVMPALDAGRVFLALTLVMLVAGTLALHRAVHGRAGPWPAAAYLLLYNYLLAWGFVNFLFGLGMYLLAFAGWIASAERPAWARLALYSTAAVALFFSHLVALGVYGLSVAAYELWRTLEGPARPRARVLGDWAVAAGQFALPAFFLLVHLPGGAGGLTNFGTAGNKAVALLSPTLFHFAPLDFALFAFLVGVLAVGALRGRIVLAPALRAPLVALGVAALLMPNWLIGIWGVDFRLPTVIALLLAAGLRPRGWSPRAAAAVGAIALALFGARIAAIAADWQAYDRQAAELRAALSGISNGARLLTVQNLPAPHAPADPVEWMLAAQELQPVALPDGAAGFQPAYWHLPSLAVIERAAFLPTMFTEAQQPLRAAPATASIDTPSGGPIAMSDLMDGADRERSRDLRRMSNARGLPAYWAFWPRRFDYVLVLHLGGARRNPLPELLAPVREGAAFALYAVTRPQTAHVPVPD